MIDQLALYASSHASSQGQLKYKLDVFGDAQTAARMQRWLQSRQPFGRRFDHHIHFKPRTKWSFFGTKAEREAADAARKDLYKQDAYARLQVDMEA